MLFDEHQVTRTHPKEIADLLQKQFLSVFSDPSKTNIDAANFSTPDIIHPFTEDKLEFSLSDVIDAIDEIKPGTSSGPTKSQSLFWRIAKRQWLNRFIWSGQNLLHPAKFLHSTSSQTSPLCIKKRARHSLQIIDLSLSLHISSRYLKEWSEKKLVSYLEMTNLICNKQHGFRSGRSCLSQLLHHFDDVLESLTNNADFDSIYLDYAKAFDKIDHKLLIRKLHRYSLNPKIIRWIDSFLSDRKQAVVVDGHLSFLAPIISWVPQGTVLGPILFLIFINDIEHCITNSIIRCFADDTRVSIPVFSEQDVAKLQNDLYSVNWSENNNMSLHKDKFEYMCHRYNRRGILTELPFVNELYQYSISED